MTLANSIVLNRAIDPSQTTSLRNAFANGMKKRFRKFRMTVTEVLVQDDVFGIITNQKPGEGSFRFLNTTEKITLFMRWIQQQIQDDILQTAHPDEVGRSIDSAWTNKFVQEAYKRGVIRARQQMRGFAPPLNVTGGVDAAMVTLAHMSHRAALFIRAFSELKGATDMMLKQISRIVAQGVTDGVHPKVIAQQISDVVVNGESDVVVNAKRNAAQDRAELIARTEIIRTYAEAQLTEFETWGVHGVKTKAEFLTVGDNRVCAKCAKFEKQIFEIEEARGMIPLHPLCRCVWVPNLES